MTEIVFTAENEAATDLLGQAVAAAVASGTTIALHGTLGAGKTRFTQALAAAFGIDRRDVLSPTFVLGQHYHGQRTLHHFDLYRLRDEDEFLNLGPEEYFESDGITLVEWGNKFPSALPSDRIEIEIEIVGNEARLFHIRALGPRSEACLTELHRILSAGEAVNRSAEDRGRT